MKAAAKLFTFAISCFVFCWMSMPPSASARDSLHTSIRVHEDSSVIITETIRIESGDAWFKNEFDRTLLPARRKILGLTHSKGFKVLECLRDGKPETYKIFGDKGLLIRVGDFMNTSPIPQVRTYTLKYRFDNLIVSTAQGDRLT